jgi:6-phosphogluconolactonase
MTLGDGPRHLTFHPNNKWIYILNELSGVVTIVQKNSTGQYEKGVSISTLPDDFEDSNTSADIHISSDGKFLYASNRGHNSIVIYNVNELDGSLTLITHESTKGDAPRNFSLSPDENYLLVANQLTNNIISFKRDETTGLLQFVDEIEVPAPVCILF